MDKPQLQFENNDTIKSNTLVDLKKIFQIAWSGRKTIIITVFISLIIGQIFFYKTPKTYLASTTFYKVESSSGAAGAAAALLGLGGSSEDSNIPYVLTDLVKSRRILKNLIALKWQTEKSLKPVSLMTFWKIKGKTNSEIMEKTLKKLSRCITVSDNKKSGFFGDTGEAILITVSVKIEDPKLAADLANQIAVLTSNFLENAKNKNIVESINFIDKRLSVNRKELLSAEEQLRLFKQRNQVVVSAELQLEYARLQREVSIKQEVYLTLIKQKEMNLIEEVKKRSAICVLDVADKPLIKVAPIRLKYLFASFLAGFLFGGIIHIINSYYKASILIALRRVHIVK